MYETIPCCSSMDTQHYAESYNTKSQKKENENFTTNKTTTQWKDRKGPWIAAQHLTTKRRRKISADAATEHNRHLMSFMFYRVSQLFPLPPSSSSSSSCPKLTFNNNPLSFKSHPLSPPVTVLLHYLANQTIATKSNCLTLNEYAHLFRCEGYFPLFCFSCSHAESTIH